MIDKPIVAVKEKCPICGAAIYYVGTAVSWEVIGKIAEILCIEVGCKGKLLVDRETALKNKYIRE